MVCCASGTSNVWLAPAAPTTALSRATSGSEVCELTVTTATEPASPQPARSTPSKASFRIFSCRLEVEAAVAGHGRRKGGGLGPERDADSDSDSDHDHGADGGPEPPLLVDRLGGRRRGGGEGRGLRRGGGGRFRRPCPRPPPA